VAGANRRRGSEARRRRALDELRRVFTDDEIVELVALISFVIVGGQTFGAVLGIEPSSAEYALAYEERLEQSMGSARR
jgi:hypothetical protein